MARPIRPHAKMPTILVLNAMAPKKDSSIPRDKGGLPEQPGSLPEGQQEQAQQHHVLIVVMSLRKEPGTEVQAAARRRS